ncbi:pilin [Candidatus Parcubacteria bacterium]|nr:pilin [Patescibacteria group bacterium]MBU4309817.1 pilin [Patescibacteria group bacterium]MBU4432235.1 pilin [Patescibacteria group bacterium]MBU4578156.1 pilin [Patescibacteria group bacterium]MCG2696693.1 pilin [Candidatus Parcubacteria bacterium]
MKKIKITLVSLFMSLSFVNIAFAITAPLGNLGKLREKTSFAEGEGTDTAMAENIGIGINLFLSILGIIFVILIIYAGYKWMMAQGDDGEIKKAKSTINRAVIGLIIIIGSFAIWNLISNKLLPV